MHAKINSDTFPTLQKMLSPELNCRRVELWNQLAAPFTVLGTKLINAVHTTNDRKKCKADRCTCLFKPLSYASSGNNTLWSIQKKARSVASRAGARSAKDLLTLPATPHKSHETKTGVLAEARSSPKCCMLPASALDTTSSRSCRSLDESLAQAAGTEPSAFSPSFCPDTFRKGSITSTHHRNR